MMNPVAYLETYVDLRLLRKAMLGLAALIFILIPIDSLWIYLGKAVSVRADFQSFQETKTGKFEPEASYLGIFDKSTLFGRGTSEVSVPVFKASLAELTKDYRLKGVILAGEPEAIVEDARISKTIFVKTGDKVGELTVKVIKEGSVVLSYYGEEKEIKIE